MDLNLTDAIVLLNSRRIGSASGNGSLVAMKEKHTCYGELTFSSVGLIEMWRQMISSIKESIEKEITKLKTMMPKPTESYSDSTKKFDIQVIRLIRHDMT